MIETYEIQLFSKYLSLVSDAAPSHRKLPTVGVTVCGVVGDPQFNRIGDLIESCGNPTQVLHLAGGPSAAGIVRRNLLVQSCFS